MSHSINDSSYPNIYYKYLYLFIRNNRKYFRQNTAKSCRNHENILEKASVRRSAGALILATVMGLATSPVHATSSSSDLQLGFRYVYNPVGGSQQGDTGSVVPGSFAFNKDPVFDFSDNDGAVADYDSNLFHYPPSPVYLGIRGMELNIHTSAFAIGSHVGSDYPAMASGTVEQTSSPQNIVTLNLTSELVPEFYLFADMRSVGTGASMTQFEMLIGGNIPIFCTLQSWGGSSCLRGNSQVLPLEILPDGRLGLLFSLPQTDGAYDFSMISFKQESTATAAVPEPANWTMLIAGFGIIGVAARRHRASLTAFTT